MTDVSIAIVTYNNGKDISNLLASIFEYTADISFTVYLVDNMSTDSTVQIVRENFPQVQIIESGENKGFGSGHNHLLHVQSRYHVICNPDILLRCNVLKELADYMDAHPECALVTPKVLGEDGEEQKLPKLRPTAKYMILGRLSNRFDRLRKYRDEYTMQDVNFLEPTEIEFCTGCFMFLRTEIWKKVGGFDERFFMYLEDADLSDRVRAYGKVVFYPDTYVVHGWARGSAKSLKLLRIHVQSMFKYMHKRRKMKS